jgi:hypothetical protein
MLTTRFEELRMGVDETFNEFYTRLNGIVNLSFNLGEKITDNKGCQKNFEVLALQI